jgi:hypothetical protein
MRTFSLKDASTVPRATRPAAANPCKTFNPNKYRVRRANIPLKMKILVNTGKGGKEMSANKFTLKGSALRPTDGGP